MELTQLIKLNRVLHDGSFNITNGGEYMVYFGIYVLICTLAILLLCLLSRNRVTFPVYIIPIIFSLLSIIVILISFIWGGWKGLGLGAIGLVLLLASVLSFILAALFAKINERK